ncbi:MAG: hypothetical protein II266_03040 [Clostridia bacterium]|nr:hypothetical protein [Clostridia bacterium]
MKNLSRFTLHIKKPSYGEMTYDEAVSIYQNARNMTRHLSVVASGAESAICLMLASRFMPDEIHIFPLLGCGVDTFLNEVSKRVPFLYFICAPIRIYVSSTITEYEVIRLKRLLSSFSSFKKEIVYVENEFETLRSLTNADKPTKTLA